MCGFCCERFDKDWSAGYTGVGGMWLSFPCIRIPNRIALEAANWYQNEVLGNPLYRSRTSTKNGDDSLFWTFLRLKHMDDVRILKVRPCLVEHVDWILGGSSVNQGRKGVARAVEFDDLEGVEALERRINERK